MPHVVHGRTKRRGGGRRGWIGGVIFPSSGILILGTFLLVGMRPSWLLQTCLEERSSSLNDQISKKKKKV